MCGIWGYIVTKDIHEITKLFESFMKVQNRGPDRSDFKIINEILRIYFGFHRLSIMDRSTTGDQPFTVEHENRSIYAMCNGEIYNYQKLIDENKIEVRGGSDCEILPHMYIKYGFKIMMRKLVGEFAVCVLDIDHQNNVIHLHVGRDQTGVRPLFIGMDENGFGFSSTLSGLIGIIDPGKIRQLGRAEIMNLTIGSNGLINHCTEIYYDLEENVREKENDFNQHVDIESTKSEIRSHLIEAVVCRLESDRPIGALLSGGLDSSLVVAIAANHLRKSGKQLRTFSIGIPGSTDRQYAEIVATHCGTSHTHVEFSESDFLNAIQEVIDATETYDITTVRASTGHYLIAKWIRENTDIKVVIGGDGSDEVCSGYMYFHNAPSAMESHKENLRLVEEICYFDVLRADRCIAYNGLEARVPFLHHPFVEYYLSIDPRIRMPMRETIDGSLPGGRRIEKWLLRKSFDLKNDESNDWLPPEILWRMKEAFSDGVSGKKKSWYEIIQEHVKNLITENDFKDPEINFHIKPHTLEAVYIRKMFNAKFHPHVKVIPYYWMPRFSGDIKDPSARVLDVYSMAEL